VWNDYFNLIEREFLRRDVMKRKYIVGVIMGLSSLALINTGVVAADAQPDSEASSGPVQAQVPVVGRSVVSIDPITGEPTMPLPGEIPAPTSEKVGSSPNEPWEEESPVSGVILRSQSPYEVYMHASVDGEGKVKTHCTQQPPNVGEVIQAGQE
jgi:hypothetical protein